MPDLDTLIGWTAATIATVVLVRHGLRLLHNLASRHVDQMVADALNNIDDDPWPQWPHQEVIGLNDTPTYTATAEHIAKWAAVDVDREWAELNGEVG